MDFPFPLLPAVPFITVIWGCFAVGIILSVLTIFWLLRPLLKVGGRASRIATAGNTEDAPKPAKTCKASVIVYGISSEERILEYLEMANRQDYPDYEVILVMDSTVDNRALLAEKCAHIYPRTYITFIPPGSHNLSRRKLAYTLGIKASKGDVVITTCSAASIPSEQWLAEMMRPFNQKNEIEMVLGYSHIDFTQMRSIWRWYREFDDMITDSQWIGYALMEKPYRGDGNNLAFKRDIFFQHKGYAKSIYLHSGDDDLFVSEIASGNNTRMVLTPRTILKTEWGASTGRIWAERKEQYIFTSHWLNRGPFIRARAVSSMQWLTTIFYALAILLNAWLLYNKFAETTIYAYLPLTISTLCLFGFWLTEILIYRKAAANMGYTRLWWSIPLFWLWKPLGDILFTRMYRHLKVKNFTWQRKK